MQLSMWIYSVGLSTKTPNFPHFPLCSLLESVIKIAQKDRSRSVPITLWPPFILTFYHVSGRPLSRSGMKKLAG